MKHKRAITITVAVVAAAALAVGGVVAWSIAHKQPLPLSEQCSARVGGQTTTITLEQARNAAIIAGVSVQRGLVPRAASIGLTTAYQESGIRNLDHGHADSLGLFQQRPSKGWGTPEEVTDPWYSSAAFYKALVRVKDWQTRDLGDVAQAVQRSAYPDAYDKHVANGRTLASALAGETPASFTCAIRSTSPADPDGLAEFLTKTYGKKASVQVGVAQLTVTASSPAAAWSVAEAAVATTKQYGVASVALGGYRWTFTPWSAPSWAAIDDVDADARVVTIMLVGK